MCSTTMRSHAHAGELRHAARLSPEFEKRGLLTNEAAGGEWPAAVCIPARGSHKPSAVDLAVMSGFGAHTLRRVAENAPAAEYDDTQRRGAVTADI